MVRECNRASGRRRWQGGGRTRVAAGLAAVVAALGTAWAGAALATQAGGAVGATDSLGDAQAITLVVPFSAGGPTDAVARALAQALTETSRQPVRVDNRAGAGGTRGAAEVARAAPDGRTLLLHHVGMATAPELYRALPFDPRRDFAPIGRVVDVPMTLVVPVGSSLAQGGDPVRSLRSRADRIVVAYAGPGAASHLCGLLLAAALRKDMIQVPYGGTGPALRDLQAGRADLLCDQTTNTAGPIRSGRLEALGALSRQRLPGLPAIPTLSELGLPGLDLAIWHGLYAPAGTPPHIVARLSGQLVTALGSPAFRAAMAEADVLVATPAMATPAALAALLAQETARWSPILKKAGHHAD